MENILQNLQKLKDNTKQSRTHSIVDEINEKLTHLKNLNKSKLEWYNNFVDFVEEYDDGIYNDACEYADKIKEDEN
jgi:hypothetical protein|tara:strand:+ start:5586 stop:5813 length:228 start_codon:yes stop_codon:yes gene_type:complete